MPLFPAIDDDRLHRLAQRGAEGLLTPSEARELSEWMDRSESARHIFAGYCQLLVALECEPCLHDVLAESVLPENVVPMPGCRVFAPAPARPARPRFILPATAAGLVAALLIGSVAVFGQAGPPPSAHRTTKSEHQSGKRTQTVLAGSGREREFAAGRDIRLLLADTCFQCHGLDEAPRRVNGRPEPFQAAVNAAEFR